MMGHLTLYARAADYSCQALADDGTFIPIHFVGVDPKAGTGKALLEVGKPLTVSIKEDHELLIIEGQSSTQYSGTEYYWMISARGAGPYKMIFSVHHAIFDEPEVTGGSKIGKCMIDHQ